MLPDSPPPRFDHIAFWGLTDKDDLIQSSEDGFVVYINSKGDLHWETTTKYDKKVEKNPKFDRAAHNAIITSAALLEATPNDDFREPVRKESKRLIGEALVCSFDQDYDTARKMISDAEQYLRARGEEAARFWYLRASVATTTGITVIGCLIFAGRDRFIFEVGPAGFWLAMAFVAGSIGALISIFTRTGKLAIGYAAGRKLLYLESTVRVLTGAFSGALAALAVKSEIILTALTHGGHLDLVMFLAAATAGTTERLMTSLFSKLETGFSKLDTGEENSPEQKQHAKIAGQSALSNHAGNERRTRTKTKPAMAPRT